MAASATIGALKVSLSLDSAQFESGLGKSKKSADSFALSISKGLVGGLATAAAGFLSFDAVINGVNRSLEKFGSVADKAASAGIDAEFFQGLTHAASLAGIGMESLSGALDTFNKNVGLASEGKGKLVSQLQALNPELLRNIELATTQEGRIKAVADAIRDETDASRQAAIATAAFGGEGVKLVAILREGGAAIDNMVAKARDMGIIVSRDLVERADELGDKLDTAAQIVDTQLSVGFVALAPLMADAAGWAAELARLLGIAYEQTKAIEQRQFLRPLQNQLAETYNAMQPVKDRITEIETELAGNGPNGMILRLDLADAKTKLADFEAQATRLLDRITELQGRPTGNSGTTPAAAQLEAPNPNLFSDAGLGLALGDAINVDLPTKFADSVEGMADRTVPAINKVTSALQLNADAFKGLGAVSKLSAEEQIESTIGALGTITGALAGAFKDNKALAVANAVVSTAAGVMKAFEQGGLLGFAGAAAIAAAGAVQIGNILSAQPGSSSAPSVSTSTPAVATPPATVGGGRAINLTLEGGGRYSRNELEQLFRDMNDAMGDGFKLNVNPA